MTPTFKHQPCRKYFSLLPPSFCLTRSPPRASAVPTPPPLPKKKRWVNALRGAAHRDASDISPLGSPADGEEAQEGHEIEAFANPTAAAKGQGAAANIPTSASEQSLVMDSLRRSFTSRRNSSEGSGGVGGGSDNSGLADAGAARDSKKTAAIGTGKESHAALVSSEAAADGEGGGGGGDYQGVIGDGRRALRLGSSSNSSDAPTEETGPASTEESRIMEDEEHVRSKSCVFQ